MANKTDFTPDEWAKLLESPIMAALAITAAAPSGLWGLMKESLSSGWALVEAKASGPNELIKAIAADFATKEGRAAARDEVQARLSSSIQATMSGSKPAEVRMGSGKGSPEFWVARVKPGRILFELDGVPGPLAKTAFERAAEKLPIKVKVVARLGETLVEAD